MNPMTRLQKLFEGKKFFGSERFMKGNLKAGETFSTDLQSGPAVVEFRGWRGNNGVFAPENGGNPFEIPQEEISKRLYIQTSEPDGQMESVKKPSRLQKILEADLKAWTTGYSFFVQDGNKWYHLYANAIDDESNKIHQGRFNGVELEPCSGSTSQYCLDKFRHWMGQQNSSESVADDQEARKELPGRKARSGDTTWCPRCNKSTSSSSFVVCPKCGWDEDEHGSEKNEALRAVRITYDNGMQQTTDVAAGLSDEKIRNYFRVGSRVNIGDGPNDLMATIKNVEILPDGVTESRLGKLFAEGQDTPIPPCQSCGKQSNIHGPGGHWCDECHKKKEEKPKNESKSRLSKILKEDEADNYDTEPGYDTEQIAKMAPSEVEQADKEKQDKPPSASDTNTAKAIADVGAELALAEEYVVEKDGDGMSPKKAYVLRNKTTGREVLRGTKDKLDDFAKTLNANPAGWNELGGRHEYGSLRNALNIDL